MDDEDRNNSSTTVKSVGGVTGRGFLPGQSGNPQGRPKGLAAMVRAHTRDGADPILFLRRVLAGEVRGVRVEHRIAAAKELLDRGYGRPPQTLDVSGEMSASIQQLVIVYSRLSPGALAEVRAALEDEHEALTGASGEQGPLVEIEGTAEESVGL